MRDIGRMIYNTDLERKSGQIIVNMKENILRGRNMVEDCIFGLMGVNMMGIGMKIKLKGMERILG